MKDKIYNERMLDAGDLTKDVQAIIGEIKVFEAEYNRQIEPYKKKISQLEESFLDKWLTDSNGSPVRKGMTIEKDGKRYYVSNRYQQILLQYLGNPRVIAIHECRKREIHIYSDDLKEYTIVENESE